MAQSLTSESTSFTLDNMGRFLCNTLQEAVDSAGVTVAGNSRGFDVIVIGGGTFGSVIANNLFLRDGTRSRRILVLESGQFVLPEHVQNMPFMGGLPDWRVPWVSAAELSYPGLLYAFGGRSLAWGGWSPELLHDAKNNEMAAWPPGVTADLENKHFLDASDQIGVTSTNDFVHGPLHEGLRRQLFDGVKAGSGAGGTFASLTLADLPNYPSVRSFRRRTGGAEPSDADLRDWLNLPQTDATPRADLLDLLKLEAPLAVQSVTEPGLFPFNKFSATPLLIQAARIASTEADGTGPEADARKRLMVVPNCHVQELITVTQPDNWVRVVGVRAQDRSGNSQVIPLAPQQPGGGASVAVVALGTVESTRLALTTFRDSLAGRAAARMGKNLMAHLRSNLNIRVPRASLTSLPAGAQKALQTSALFVKGKANVNGADRYFHLQITASGLGKLGNNSEAELFRKIPTLEHLNAMLQADDTTVVITLRGIGEMLPDNPDSEIGLATTPGDTDHGRPKAFVHLGNSKAPAGGSAQTQSDRLLWEAMDAFTDEVALIFANKKPFEVILARGGRTVAVPANATAADLRGLHPHGERRDNLGTTHHDAGTLRMSVNAADGVTNEFGRIHDTANCYVAAPAVFPTLGSPNPMLTGVALARRTADLLSNNVLRRPAAWSPDPGFTAIFDGTGTSFNQWSRTSPDNSNGFALVSGEIVTYGGRDFGLLYYARTAFADFTLKLQFRVFDAQSHNSGVFVRFRDPLLDPTPQVLARIKAEGDNYEFNRAWTAVHSGFEVQIDDNARGDSRKDFYGVRPEPDGLRKNRTGAVYKIPAKDFIPHLNKFDDERQKYQPAPNLVPGTWYEYEIRVAGDTYTVDLTNLDTNQKTRTTEFQNTDALRGVAAENGQPAGFVGLQAYPGAQVAFRRIQVK